MARHDATRRIERRYPIHQRHIDIPCAEVAVATRLSDAPPSQACAHTLFASRPAALRAAVSLREYSAALTLATFSWSGSTGSNLARRSRRPRADYGTATCVRAPRPVLLSPRRISLLYLAPALWLVSGIGPYCLVPAWVMT